MWFPLGTAIGWTERTYILLQQLTLPSICLCQPTMEAIDELPHLPEAAAAPAPAQAIDSSPELLGALVAGQAQQTELLQKLHKTVLTSRSMINELVVSNNELKEEISKLKRTGSCEACKKKETSFAAEAMLSVAGESQLSPGDGYIMVLILSSS